MEDDIVYIDTEEIERFVYRRLIEKGYVPNDEEIELLAEIFFDFLVEQGVIADVTGEDY